MSPYVHFLKLHHHDLGFPDVQKALTVRNGLVAIGGDLSVSRMLCAYRRGIFPWYDAEHPIMWWAFARRMVLFADELKISRSLSKKLRNKTYRVSVNHAFQRVLRRCARVYRPCQPGTWLVPEMQNAYYQLYA